MSGRVTMSFDKDAFDIMGVRVEGACDLSKDDVDLDALEEQWYIELDKEIQEANEKLYQEALLRDKAEEKETVDTDLGSGMSSEEEKSIREALGIDELLEKVQERLDDKLTTEELKELEAKWESELRAETIEQSKTGYIEDLEDEENDKGEKELAFED